MENTPSSIKLSADSDRPTEDCEDYRICPHCGCVLDCMGSTGAVQGSRWIGVEYWECPCCSSVSEFHLDFPIPLEH
jgi:hypothetical protein